MKIKIKKKIGVKINLAEVITKKRRRGSIIEGMDKIKFKNPFIYIEDNDIVIKNDEELYNIEQFFLHKGTLNDRIEFAQPKLKNILYNKFVLAENDIENKLQEQQEENSESSKIDVYL